MSHSPSLPTEILDAAGAGADAAARAVRAAGGAPLQNGWETTFVYVGEAEEVALQHWMDLIPPFPAFQRYQDTPLWTLTIELPGQSRIEYKLSVTANGRRRMVLDRLNPNRARDPFGANSVVTGPLYQRPDWTLARGNGTPNVTMIDVASDALDDTRRVGLYLPPGAQTGPLPLLVAHDGSEYAEFAALTVVLDNLIADGEIPPVACALSDPVARSREYTGDPRHADHIVGELMPAVAERVEVDRSQVVALGASFGGVAVLHAAWRHPGTFSGLILQSGSFVTSLRGRRRRGPVFAPVVDFMTDLASEPRDLPDRIHVSCGRFDGLIHENRAMSAWLREAGVDVAYEEVSDGHNWENWRDRLRAGLLHTLAR